MTLLLHVSTELGHLQGGGYQRKDKWLITLQMCSYNVKIYVLNKIRDKIFKAWK